MGITILSLSWAFCLGVLITVLVFERLRKQLMGSVDELKETFDNIEVRRQESWVKACNFILECADTGTLPHMPREKLVNYFKAVVGEKLSDQIKGPKDEDDMPRGPYLN